MIALQGRPTWPPASPVSDPGSANASSATRKGWQSMDSSHVAVSAELSLGLIGPERMIVPLMASLY